MDDKGINSARGLLLFFAFMMALFVIDRALTSPARSATIPAWCGDLENDGCYEHEECCDEEVIAGVRVNKLQAEKYVCDPYVNGDCSREGIQMLSDQGIFITVLNNDPEYGCDDTSCGCEWQECYVEPVDNGNIDEE